MTLRLAHRGDWRHAPENTLPALSAALDIALCDGLEFDVRMSRDGVPVLLHDHTLGRVQRVEAEVDELDASALAMLGVPTLSEALAAIDEDRPSAFLDVELKGDDHGEPTAAVLLAHRGDSPTDAVVSSFERVTLERMRALLPAWRRWLNTPVLSEASIAHAVDLGCAGISARWESIDADGCGRASDAGLVVAAWTVRDLPTYTALERLGVVAICAEDEALDGRPAAGG
jgi:glycerophosphoryl diester phosphodiesterase